MRRSEARVLAWFAAGLAIAGAGCLTVDSLLSDGDAGAQGHEGGAFDAKTHIDSSHSQATSTSAATGPSTESSASDSSGTSSSSFRGASTGASGGTSSTDSASITGSSSSCGDGGTFVNGICSN